MSVDPIRIEVPQTTLDRIAAKIADARIGYAPVDDAAWIYGTDARYLSELIDYWRTQYHWREEEAELNRYPHFRAEIDGIVVHFQHVKAHGGYPTPIVLTHGWPGSIVEFQAVIPLLVSAGFTVVVPSLPGYGWSGRPAKPVGPAFIAGLWRKLMVEALGYPRFFAQGGDWGSAVSTRLGLDHGDVVEAIHLNLFRTVLPGPNADQALRDHWAAVRKVAAAENAYQMVHDTRPQTIGLALHDNPVGWAAWVIEKFQRWGDTRGDIESRFSKAQLITNLMTYLVTDSVISSIWAYRGRINEPDLEFPVRVPTGLAAYPAEFIHLPSRSLAERAYNVAHYAQLPAGGHFAAMEVPQIFAADVIAFFSSQIR